MILDPNVYCFELLNNQATGIKILKSTDSIIRDNNNFNDDKISLVSEDFLTKTTRNHFNSNKNINLQNNNLEYGSPNPLKNNNIPLINSIKKANTTNFNLNESPKFNSSTNFMKLTKNNKTSSNNYIDHSKINKNFTSFNKNDVTFKRGEEEEEEYLSQDFFKKIEKLKHENLSLEEKNNELEDENININNTIKKLENDLEQITLKYNTLTAKHNALLIYSTDIQKQLDLLLIDNNEKKEEITKLTNSDWGKLINQRDNLIKILSNELNYFKQEVNSLKSFNLDNNNFNDSNKIDTNEIYNYSDNNYNHNTKRISSLLENYILDNKKCKKIVN